MTEINTKSDKDINKKTKKNKSTKSKKIDIEDIDSAIDLITTECNSMKIDKTNKTDKDIDISTKTIKSTSIKTKNNKSPKDIFINITKKYKEKEDKITMWDNSDFKPFTTLTSNNRGYVGEDLVNELCSICNVSSNICGTSFKGFGKDGDINEKSIEIKTAYLGNCGSFQHELGEEPWKSNYMIFIDVAPNTIFLTIFKNFDEKKYKGDEKLSPYFPTKSITWRKNKGAFKLDTNIKINNECVKNGYSIKITDITNDELKNFFMNSIK